MLRFDFSPWAGVVSAVWLVFYILGRRQFTRVRRGTADLVLEQGRRAAQLFLRAPAWRRSTTSSSQNGKPW